jgi:hypothetical protein
MKKVKLSPLNYTKYRIYLKDFADHSKEVVHNFSHRFFAQEMRWPIGYLVDVIKERKNLTLTRTFQLAQYQGLSHLETEHLIQLVLKEDLGQISKDHFERKIDERYESYRVNTTTDQELIENIDMNAVFSVLRWARKMLSPKEIKGILHTFEMNEEEIQLYIDLLQEKKIFIAQPDGSIIFLKKELIFDDFETTPDGQININRKYAENFIRFSQAMQGPALYNSGFIEIPRSEFLNMAKKILDFRNWIIEVSRETVNAPKEHIGDTYIFQLDMNFFSVIDKNAEIFHKIEESKNQIK